MRNDVIYCEGCFRQFESAPPSGKMPGFLPPLPKREARRAGEARGYLILILDTNQYYPAAIQVASGIPAKNLIDLTILSFKNNRIDLHDSGGDPVTDGQKYIYVLFSATPYRMGSWIRYVTGEPYNHVAIAMEEDLSILYSFARRFYRTPFYGGFVTERPDRYRHKGITADIRLYRLPVTELRWRKLKASLLDMQDHAQHYLYNHLSVLAAPIHRKVPIQDAYTCAEFVVSTLNNMGYDYDPDRFYSIAQIAEPLEDYHIYTGKFPARTEQDPLFFQPQPVPHPLLLSFRELLHLCWRLAVANFLNSRVRHDIVR